MMGLLFFLMIALLILSFVAQNRLKAKMEKYSETRLLNNMSGEEAARKMLSDNGIYDVKILSVDGKLTDHYNPLDKTVNLSQEVYHGRNAAAVAVATHEVGHAVQHATAYSWLKFRSAMVPALSASSRFMPFLLIASILLSQVTLIPLFLYVLVFAGTTIFSFVTLPVEFDASNRALAWMSTRGGATSDEQRIAKDALWWAASTYVIAALSSLVTLIYYVLMFLGRSRD